MSYGCAFGPLVRDGEVVFRLWAPSADIVVLEVDGMRPQAMQAQREGWKYLSVSCGPGTRYRFRIGDTPFPDPASRQQNGGIHGWSVVRAPRARRNSWKGRPWNEAVIYEVHTGLAGGFNGVAERLDALARLGVTAVELMPVAAFPGTRNWGYDGVLPFAPAEAYGAPEDLEELVARAHAHGLMIFLDVVYNHFGPDGNYLGLCAAPFFRHDVETPWGAAIDFRQPAVRRFFAENANYWICEYGFDGLRFDAVHAMRDEGWLDSLAKELRSHAPDRHIHLILENEDNVASRLRDGFDAQWNDDIHHALHVLLTGETRGYYMDFSQQPVKKLARALSEGFVYQGEASASRNGARRGTPSGDLPPTVFVSFLQNHDQIGNRAFGERLTALASPGALRAAVALVLLAPQIPMLFMGEEIGSRAPFLYFTDHQRELAKAVREGRKKEFAAFHAAADLRDLPDPNLEKTFRRSDPESDAPERESWLDLIRALLAVRRQYVTPFLDQCRSSGADAVGDKAVIARWILGDKARLTIATNIGDEDAPAPALPAASPLWGAVARGVVPRETTTAWLERE